MATMDQGCDLEPEIMSSGSAIAPIAAIPHGWVEFKDHLFCSL